MTHLRTLAALGAALALWSGPSPADGQDRPAASAQRWQIDPLHTAAGFSVRHMMVATVRGQLGQVTGTIAYDGKDVRSISADVKIDVKGLTTQNPRRDEHLRSDEFFDVRRHPSITFKSKRVEPGANGHFAMVGDLTIRGTTREVALDVEGPTPAVKDQSGMRVGASATTKVKRFDYGLKYNELIEAGPIVADEVTITIDVEAIRPATPGTAPAAGR
jgi:polyisoprenoid-binding protein YceI